MIFREVMQNRFNRRRRQERALEKVQARTRELQRQAERNQKRSVAVIEEEETTWPQQGNSLPTVVEVVVETLVQSFESEREESKPAFESGGDGDFGGGGASGEY